MNNSGVWFACGFICIYPLVAAFIGIAIYRRYTEGGGFHWRKKE